MSGSFLASLVAKHLVQQMSLYGVGQKARREKFRGRQARIRLLEPQARKEW